MTTTSTPPATRGELRRARHRDRRRHRGLRRALWIGAVVLVVVAIVAVLAAERLSQPPPRAAVHAQGPATLTVAGTGPSISWPATGQGAVAVPALGYAAASPDQRTVPIASITKVMTAYLVLSDHPLAPGASGPSITMTQTDVDYFGQDLDLDESNVQVQVGEVLTERQLLEGLLVHSANNLAYTLARWDAGSVPAFVAKMNAEAARLGMTHTHYVDPSGYDTGSASTPADQLVLAARAMQISTFAQVVRMTSVTLPVAGTVDTYVPLDGTDLVIGIKSGFTTAAGGCDVLAALRSVGASPGVPGRPMLILAVVTGQMTGDVLEVAGNQALFQAAEAGQAVVGLAVAHRGQQVGTASVDGHRVPVVLSSGARLLGLPGQVVHRHLVITRLPRAGAAAGTGVGEVVYRLGNQRVTVPARLGARLPSLGLGQRLF